ncbi:MAG: thiamine ABC transporter substrate-binding protein, partial [Marinitoga sp. 4572_148]
ESGEAPMMVSYATDGAYSYYYYNSTKYKAFIPEEGAYVQIEGAGIVKGTKNFELAKRFIEFLLFDEFQKDIPLNQWMFPVINTEMPEAFNYALVPEKIVTISSEDINENMEKWLEEWEEIMLQ